MYHYIVHQRGIKLENIMTRIILFSSILFILSLLPIYAQQKAPFTLRFTVGLTEDEPVIYSSGYKERFNKVPLFLLDFGYEVYKNIDVSIYGGYASYMRIRNIETGVNEYGYPYTFVSRSNSNAVFYGIKGKYDLLPVIFNTERSMRFEVYPIATLGAVTSVWRNNDGNGSTSSKSYLECSIGAGGGFKITRGFGLCFEYSFGRYFSDAMHRIQGGLTFHF